MERTNPFAGLYEPIPDVNAYLDRIEVKKEEPSPAFLSKSCGGICHIFLLRIWKCMRIKGRLP